MVSIGIRLLGMIQLLIFLPDLAATGGHKEEWTISIMSERTLSDVSIDSLGSDSLFLQCRGEAVSVALDSIATISHYEGAVLSTRSYIIALGCLAAGAGIFLNNAPGPDETTIWWGAIYGLEFGGAMLLGGLVGVGVGYAIDQASIAPETFDLTKESRSRKHQIIEGLISGTR